MRHITQEGLDLIKSFEGFSPTVYLCPAGKKTIGYGHVVRPGEVFTEINEDGALELLRIDVARAEMDVCRFVTVPLTDGQFNALVSFTFNLGGRRLQASTLRMKLNRGEYEGAGREFGKWCYVSGRRSAGLLRRREAERERFVEST